MPMYSLIKYSGNYSKISESLYKFCREEPNHAITESELFKSKSKFLENANNAGIIKAKIAVPLKYLNDFWRTLEIPLINCKINLILTWSANCVNFEGDRETTFAIADTKLHVLVVTLSTQDNKKLLQQLKSGFRHTINWDKYQPKISTDRPKKCLDYLIDDSFQGVNRLFVLSFNSNVNRTRHTGYFLT